MKRFTQALLLGTALGGISTFPALAAEPVESRIYKLESTIHALQDELEAVKEKQAEAAAAQKAGPVFKAAPVFEADTAFFNEDQGGTDLSDGTDLRRARLGVEGTIEKDFQYRLEAEIGRASRNDRGDQEVDIRDAYVRYSGLKGTKITVGQHKTPNSLSRLTSSTDLVLLERPLFVEAFTHRITAGGDYKSGVSAAFGGDNWTATAGVFGENFAIRSAAVKDEGWGPAARFTFAPVNEKDAVLHLGASGYWRKTAGVNTVRLRTGPEISNDDTRFVDTGNITADDYAFGGLELAGILGPLYLQSEYGVTEINSNANGDLSFDGGYVTASYLLTGESRRYKGGVFQRPKPASPFDLNGGGWGAWEIAARYSTVDLNDKAVQGGKEDNFAAGVNWYLNDYLRLQSNWVHFDADLPAGADQKGDAFITRVGVSW